MSYDYTKLDARDLERGWTEALEWNRLRDDNARLRALIKAQEWGDRNDRGPFCPWCQGSRDDEAEHTKRRNAFTPSGEAK